MAEARIIGQKGVRFLIVLELKQPEQRNRTMWIQARNSGSIEHFARATEKLDAVVERLKKGEIEPLAATEEYLRLEGDELMRLLLQARLDVLLERERTELGKRKSVRVAGIERRVSGHNIESLFGRVRHRRHALIESGKPWHFPMDEALSLPADLYSYAVRRRVAEEVAHGSLDHVVQQILVSLTTTENFPESSKKRSLLNPRFLLFPLCPTRSSLGLPRLLHLESRRR